MRELRVAESAGFCFGVSRSVNLAEEMLENGPCASFGMLIHNEDVVRRLAEKGMRTVTRVEEVLPGERVLIRAHGVPPDTLKALDKRGALVTDATCPKVIHIHRIVERASAEGRFILIIGMKQHPEVEAIRAIKKRCTNAEVSDTICFATSTRQEEAAALSALCDAMVVIGGKHSANSLHLAEICSQYCENVQFIERPEELNYSQLKGSPLVGLTAGASTPAWIIKEVRNKMSDEIRVDEVQEEAVVSEAVEAAEDAVQDAAVEAGESAPAVEKELSFDEMLEETLKTIYNGEKYSGLIPVSDFTDAGVKVEDVVKVGDTIEAIVVRVNDVEGTATLSKRRLDSAKAWVEVEEAVENNSILEGVVTEENKGGVVVNVNGIRVFVPASQTDLPREAELAQLLNKPVRLRITEVSQEDCPSQDRRGQQGPQARCRFDPPCCTGRAPRTR